MCAQPPWEQSSHVVNLSAAVQMIMSTFMTDVGMKYEQAVEIIKGNKEQLEKYGSNMPIRDVGFYIRKNPQNQLGTGRDKIMLITGRIRQAGEGKNSVLATTRYPWDDNAKSQHMYNLKQHWKLCKDEKAARNLWNFWYKCVLTSPATSRRCQRAHVSKHTCTSLSVILEFVIAASGMLISVLTLSTFW